MDADLQGAYQPDGIVLVHRFVVFGILLLEHLVQLLHTVLLQHAAQIFPQGGVGIRQVVNAVAYRRDVKSASAGQYHLLMCPEQLLQLAQRSLFKLVNVIAVMDGKVSDEMVFHPLQFLSRRRSCADAHLFVELPRVRRDNFRA